jgi:hypothetical protein
MQEIARMPPSYIMRYQEAHHIVPVVDDDTPVYLRDIDEEWRRFEIAALRGLVIGTLLSFVLWTVVTVITYRIFWG